MLTFVVLSLSLLLVVFAYSMRHYFDRPARGVKTLALTLVLLNLGGCGPRTPTTENEVNLVTANAASPIEGMPGYTLRSLVVDRNYSTVHFVYVLEKDGTPVAGSTTDYTASKSQQSVLSLQLGPSLAPNANAPKAPVTCFTAQECIAKAQELHVREMKQEALQRHREAQKDILCEAEACKTAEGCCRWSQEKDAKNQ